METKGMEELYGKAARLINEMVPEAWNKVYLYAECDDEYESIFFYYDTESRNDPVYSLDIPELFSVDKNQFERLSDELYVCFQELREEFKRNGQEPWTSLTFVLESTGRFKIDYAYEDLAEQDSFEVQVIWAYNMLGIKIGGDYGEKLLQKYLNTAK